MANVVWADAIKTVSGALVKINKKSPHAADQKMILATHRVAETTNPNCSSLFIRGLQSITRTTPVSNDERAQRGRFGTVAAAVAARAKDLSKVTTDQQNFLAQKNQAGGEPTMNAYLWKVCGQEYDTAHPQG